MKRLFAALFIISFFAGFAFAQEEQEVKKEIEKKIIIKIVDEDGTITTKILEGEDAMIEDEDIIIRGDSIKIEVEVDEDSGETKIIKQIIIPGMEDIDIDFEGLEDLEKNIQIFEFDGHDLPEPHMFWMEGGEHPHEGFKNMLFFDGEDSKKAKLGVYIEDAEKGVKVKEVIENSSAYSVGILAGDVITHIDGKKMTNTEELIREVGLHEVGDMIKIKLKRNGKTKKFTARLQGNNSFNFKMPNKFHQEFGPRFQDGMKKMKHHMFRGIDEFEKQHEGLKHKCTPQCEKKCTADHKKECLKEKIIDKEIKMEKKMKKMEKKMKKKEHEMQMKKHEMQKKEHEMIHREIEKSEEEEN